MQTPSFKILPLLVGVLSFSFFLTGVFADLTPSPNPTGSISSEVLPGDPSVSPEMTPTPTPGGNVLYDAIKERQDALKQITEKTEAEKIVDKADADVLETGLEKETVEGIRAELTADIAKMQEDLAAKNAEIESLKKQLREGNMTSEESQKEMEAQKQALEEEKKMLMAKVQQKEGTLQSVQQELERLSNIEQIKELALRQAVSLKKELDAKENTEKDAKMQVLYLFLGGFALAYVAKIFLSRKHQNKYRHYFTYFDIFSVLGFFFFLVWFFFYIKPEMLIMLVFLAGTLILIMQEYIVSLLSSFFIVNQYMIGERIRYQGGEGIITQLTPLRVVLQVIDDHGDSTGEDRRIPNSLFMKQEVVKVQHSDIEKTSLQVVFRETLQKDVSQVIEYIEKEILQKNIVVKMHNEKTNEDEYYHLHFFYSGEGRQGVLISWQEMPEKNKRIKKKIMSYVQAVTIGSLELSSNEGNA